MVVVLAALFMTTVILERLEVYLNVAKKLMNTLQQLLSGQKNILLKQDRVNF